MASGTGSMDELLTQLTTGNIRALARAITSVENRTPNSSQLLKALYPKSGKARVVGITGSPGSGKSTLVDKLAADYASSGQQIGVVAVDPSSPFTGGAILGDRIRMSALEQDPGIYIRSMATRGHLGGLAATTADVVTVLDAAGRDPVIVETVGVGQDEVDIVRLADISVVVLVPGMGDDVQALKAGIMEIGDIFVINKCDRPGTDQIERALTAMLALASDAHTTQAPPIIKTVATVGQGIGELRRTIDEIHADLGVGSRKQERRQRSVETRLRVMLQERLVQSAIEHVFSNGEFDALVDSIVRRESDPYSVVEKILEKVQFGRLT
jgi:LAO/AO transport system kinase